MDANNTLFTEVISYLYQVFPQNRLGMLLFLWLAISFACRLAQAAWPPPAPGTFLAFVHHIVAILAGSFAWASAAFQVGRHSVMIPVDVSRENASLKLGFDPDTTSPRKIALPVPIKRNDEANASEKKDPIADAQEIIAQANSEGDGEKESEPEPDQSSNK